jgi:hypothetical protein
MLLRLSLVAASLALVQALSDGRPHANFMRKPTIPIVPVEHTAPVTSRNGTVLPPYNTTYTFQQLIDHNNVFFFPAPRRAIAHMQQPSLGTFTQRYWHTYEFYEEGTNRTTERRST